MPIIWAVVASLKSEKEVLAYPPQILFHPTLENYRDAVTSGFSIFSSFVTSAILSGSATVITIMIALPAAYAFARLRLPGKKPLGFYTLVTQMIPPVGLVIPYFLILHKIGWLDTYQGLIIVFMTFSLPFAIWLMISYMEDLLREMEEAAFLDKAGRFRTLWYVIPPQVRGGIAVTGIFIFPNAWNEFLFTVEFSGDHVRPVTVAMYNFVSVEQTLWAKLVAAALVAMLPVIIIGLPSKSRSSRASPSAPSKGDVIDKQRTEPGDAREHPQELWQRRGAQGYQPPNRTVGVFSLCSDRLVQAKRQRSGSLRDSKRRMREP